MILYGDRYQHFYIMLQLCYRSMWKLSSRPMARKRKKQSESLNNFEWQSKAHIKMGLGHIQMEM